ncbi:hypothetical protein GC194_04650 [bacterium]|nr:hypothetical protein [bacterium]
MLSISGLYVFAFILAKNRIQQQVKEKIEAGLPESQLVKFTFSTQQWQQLPLEENREFELDGHKYDIVKRKVLPGKVVLSCIADHDEERLFASLNKLVHLQMTQDPVKNQTSNSFVKLLLEKYLPATRLFTQHQTSRLSSHTKQPADQHTLAGYKIKYKKPPRPAASQIA